MGNARTFKKVGMDLGTREHSLAKPTSGGKVVVKKGG